jgi:hypothetical protein
VVVLVLWVAGARLTVAVTAAIWASALTIVTVEVVIGGRAHLPRRDLLRQTALGALLGLLLLALSVILH